MDARPVSEFLARLEELDKAATPGPWVGGFHTQIWSTGIPKGHWSDVNSDDEPPMGHIASVKNADDERGDEIRRPETAANANLIVHLRNHTDEIKAMAERESRWLAREARYIAVIKAAREVEMNAGFDRDRNAAMVGVLRMADLRAALEALDK